jgi:iron complex outermembrane receptor protein
VNGGTSVSDVANVGKTLRKGWDAQLNLQPSERWRAWLAYSRQKAVIVTPDPSAEDTRGRQIENVPRWLASAGVEWQALPQLKLSAWGNGQGSYYVDRTNTLGRYGGYVLANLGASWMLDTRDELGLQLKNVADRFYVYAWYDSGSSGYSPSDGRALYLNWTRRF